MNRVNVAIILLAVAIVCNIVVLVRGDESPGLPIAAVIFLSASALALFSERRER
jgi:hypothetical protein